MQDLSPRTRIAAALSAGLIAAVVPVASANPVTGGKSVLHPDVDTFEGLADMSMSVGATGAAKDGRRGISFPIRSGDVDEGPSGTIEHRGGLVFARNTAAGGVVKLTQYRLKLGPNKAKLFAKSGGAEVRFLDFDLSDANISGEPGSRLKIKDAEATLAKPAAEVLSEAFDFPFRKGILIGTMTVKASLTS